MRKMNSHDFKDSATAARMHVRRTSVGRKLGKGKDLIHDNIVIGYGLSQ